MMEFAGVLAIAGCCFALVDIAFQLHGIRDSLRGIVKSATWIGPRCTQNTWETSAWLKLSNLNAMDAGSCVRRMQITGGCFDGCNGLD